MITIISGTCRTSSGIVTSKDGKLSLPPEEESRLVRRGVAEYVTAPVLSTPVATPAETTAGVGLGVNLPTTETPTEGLEVVDGVIGHLERTHLMEMKISDLRTLAKDMGVNISPKAKKEAIVDALAAVDLFPEDVLDAEDAPVLDAEDPVK